MLLDTVQILQDKNKSFNDLNNQIQLYCIFSILYQLFSSDSFYIKIKLSDEDEKINYDEVNKKIQELLTKLKILQYIEYKWLDDRKGMEYILKDISYHKNIGNIYNQFIKKIGDTFNWYKRKNEYKEIFYTKVKHLYSVKWNNLELSQSFFKDFEKFPFTEIILYLINLEYIELVNWPIMFFTDWKLDLKYHFILSDEFEKIIQNYNPKEDIGKIKNIIITSWKITINDKIIIPLTSIENIIISELNKKKNSSGISKANLIILTHQTEDAFKQSLKTLRSKIKEYWIDPNDIIYHNRIEKVYLLKKY